MCEPILHYALLYTSGILVVVCILGAILSLWQALCRKEARMFLYVVAFILYAITNAFVFATQKESLEDLKLGQLYELYGICKNTPTNISVDQ